jgi:hypothetical protein
MSLQRISVAVPIVDTQIDPESVVSMFHDWIRGRAVEGLLIDVTRYAHVPDGPGIVLVGHEGDYALDLAAGRPWLRYTLKRDNDGSARELVARSLRRLAGAAAQAAQAGIETADGEIVVRICDRLRAPNDAAVRERLTSEVAAGIADVLGDVTLQSSGLSDDPREPLGFRVLVEGGNPLAELAVASG